MHINFHTAQYSRILIIISFLHRRHLGPRTDPFSAVRRRPAEADQTSPAVPSRSHAYADDTQIYGFCQPSDVNALADRVSACFDEISK